MTNVVTFPGLGLEFTLNRVAFELFGRPIYWYGIIIACGFLLAVALCSRWAAHYGIEQEQILDLLIFAVPLSVIGARLYYVIFYLDLYVVDGRLDLGKVVRISDGGLAIYGGVIAAALTLLVFCRVRKINFLAFADVGVQGLLIGQLVGRWGNFMNVEAYGGVTSLPWRMCSESIAVTLYNQGVVDESGYRAILEGTLGVHPTFLYESLWNLVGLLLIHWLGRRLRRFDGQLFLSYVLWYGVGRGLIEGLRTDSLYFFGLTLFGVPIRTSQVLAFASAAVAGAVLAWQLLGVRHDPAQLYVNRISAKKQETTQEKETVPEDGEKEE